MQPHRRQPTRLCHPWDSPGKNTGVGCHFLLQCMKVKSESEVAQSCLTLHDPMDGSPPGSSVRGIFQARVLEWGAIAFSAKGLTGSKYFLLLPLTTALPTSSPVPALPHPLLSEILLFLYFAIYRLIFSKRVNKKLKQDLSLHHCSSGQNTVL